MISGLILWLGWRIYKRDCIEIGKENLAVPWEERVMAWLACGFWAIDAVIIGTIIEILCEIYK